MTTHFPSDVAFTPNVKAIQERRGSRAAYARLEQGRGFRTAIDAELSRFIAEQTSFFMATANADGQPYVQHRGGPPGFLRVLDASTLAFADYRGNRQYITLGNLAENPKLQLFLIDYARRTRVKIWGEARVVEGDAALMASLMPPDYDAHAEQAIVMSVSAWDRNCNQHIPQRFEARDVEAALAERDAKITERDAKITARDARIAELEAALQQARA